MTDRELMQQALEALEIESKGYADKVTRNRRVITALRERLAQPEQAPVAWMWKDGTITSDPDRADGTWTPLYTTPPRREWVGLTEEECISAIDEDFDFGLDNGNVSNVYVIRYARAIEAKLKEKNA